MSDMSPELIGIISVGASLAVLIMGLFAWLRQDMKGQGKEIKELHKKITEQGQKHSDEITEVKIEVASLKATVETYSGSGWTHPKLQPWRSPPRTTARIDLPPAGVRSHNAHIPSPALTNQPPVTTIVTGAFGCPGRDSNP